MKLLEYEAKDLLHKANIPVPKSSIVRSGSDIVDMPIVLKSQVPIGGRGKAGGIKVIEKLEELRHNIEYILSLPIGGFFPKVLLAEEKLQIQHEYYLSLVIDKSAAEIHLMAHTKGGIKVEENDSKSFLKIVLNNKNIGSAGESLAEYFDLPGQSFALQDMVENLYQCFTKNDMTLLEINPLVYTAGKKLVASDCKIELDDVAAFRHPDWNFEDKPANSNFVILDSQGTVATIANGAGLAMATVDAVVSAGMTPANFLDIGGGANSESILRAFKKIAKSQHVKVIVINIFAGITRCDEVAKAIIEAQKQITDLPSLSIRLAGTNVELAKELLDAQKIPLLPTLEVCLDVAKQKVDHG
jgi:succinyl-CoA synthetase beta subunit